MKAWLRTAALAAACGTAGVAGAADTRPAVEVVFVLDTTSSMGGLIEGAKQRIWAIANEIAKGRPAPRVRMGLVAFRDKGDEYVTKVFDLSENLDRTYQDLLSLNVGGGGDGPEHVIAGLSDAVEKVSWSKEPKTFRVVYLVGDAPPHEDYPEAPKLSAVLEKAVRRGLVVNTVSCGSDSTMVAAFERIARGAEGRLLPVPHDGGMAAVATPFDAKLAALSSKLDGTTLAYGATRGAAAADLSLSRAVAASAPAPAAAERALFKAKKGFAAESDLASAVAEGKVKLEDVRDEELPNELRALDKNARSNRLAEVTAERARLNKELAGLAKDRAEWLKANAGKGRADAFDARLVSSLKAQAASKGIVY